MAFPLFDLNGNRQPFKFYGGASGSSLLLTMNQMFSPDGADEGEKSIYEINEVSVKQGFKSTIETRDNEDGLEMYGVFKTHKLILIEGVARAGITGNGNQGEFSNPPWLSEMQDELSVVFDPALRTFDSPWGLRAEILMVHEGESKQIYARPQQAPDIITSEYFGNSFPFSITLLAGDPRTYSTNQTVTTKTSPYTTINLFHSGNYPTPMDEIRLTFAGAGNSNFLLVTNHSAFNPEMYFNVDFSGIGSGSHTASLFPRDRNLVLDGLFRNDLFKSPPVWGELPPGGAVATITGTTNLSQAQFYYRNAYSL